MRSSLMIVDAALAAYRGDLSVAHRWLSAIGREPAWEGDQITCQQQGYLPAGGLCTGGDPLNGLVQLLLLTAGPMIFQCTDMTKPLMREVNERWKVLRKGDEASALAREQADYEATLEAEA